MKFHWFGSHCYLSHRFNVNIHEMEHFLLALQILPTLQLRLIAALMVLASTEKQTRLRMRRQATGGILQLSPGTPDSPR